MITQKFTINDKAYEVNEKLFYSIFSRYQIGLEKSMRGRDFIFDCVYLLYYNCHKINFERSGLYIDSLDWIKNEKATINPINNKDNKCFQYVITVTLNHEEIGKHPEKVIKVKHFRDKYNWEGINYPSEKDDCKR